MENNPIYDIAGLSAPICWSMLTIMFIAQGRILSTILGTLIILCLIPNARAIWKRLNGTQPKS